MCVCVCVCVCRQWDSNLNPKIYEIFAHRFEGEGSLKNGAGVRSKYHNNFWCFQLERVINKLYFKIMQPSKYKFQNFPSKSGSTNIIKPSP